MRKLVVSAAVAALCFAGTMPAAAQDERHVDWGQFGKQEAGKQDVDWDRILDRDRDRGEKVDWTTFSGTKPEASPKSEQAAPRKIAVPAPAPATASEPSPSSEELRYRIGGMPEQKKPAAPARIEKIPEIPEPPVALEAPAPEPRPAAQSEDIVEIPAPDEPVSSLVNVPVELPDAPVKARAAGDVQPGPADEPQAVAVAVPPAIKVKPAPAPPPAPKRLYSDEAVAHFLQVAMFDKDALKAAHSVNKARSQVLVRWDAPVRLRIVGGDAASRGLAEEAARVVGRALPSQHTGLEVVEGGDANMALFILDGDGGGISGYTENTYRDGQVISGSRIVLYKDGLHPGTAVRQLLRALGFTGCDLDGRDSVMHCGVGAPEQGGEMLTELDRQALKMLYHPALEPGMALDTVRKAVESLR